MRKRNLFLLLAVFLLSSSVYAMEDDNKLEQFITIGALFTFLIIFTYKNLYRRGGVE